MANEVGSSEQIVLTRLMRLNASAHGVVIGMMAGLAMFIATNWLVLKGGEIVGPHLALLGYVFYRLQSDIPGKSHRLCLRLHLRLSHGLFCGGDVQSVG